MEITQKHIVQRAAFMALAMVVVAVLIIVQLFNIQVVNGEKYRLRADRLTTRVIDIPAERGNIFADDGSILSSSTSKYDIYFDAVTVRANVFTDQNVQQLADSLHTMLHESASYFRTKLKKARLNKQRYVFIARRLSYPQYQRIKKFPIFNKGAIRGGFIAKQSISREYPAGELARRTIGSDKMVYGKDGKLYSQHVGVEGYYSNFLKGKNGSRLMQKIGKNKWKPINDNNELEPVEGKDIISTLDLTIQDIAHNALKNQLQKFEAEFGTAIVMEVKTGAIKAMVNLGKNEGDTGYYETVNYAVGTPYEPGSTFKLASLLAVLEEQKIDTATVIDTGDGKYKVYDKYVRDDHHGGFGQITIAEIFEKSSNIGFVKLVQQYFNSKPKKFVDRLRNMHLDKKTGIVIKGEKTPKIPYPTDKTWSGLSLPWMTHGYGVELTPLQILTFYNAVANNGKMMKPYLVSEIKQWNTTIKKIQPVVIDPSIASPKNIKIVQKLLENVVKKGTAKKIYNPDFLLAGKTGTSQANYWKGAAFKQYISSFSGFFPADNPQYSCIVVVYHPKKEIGYFGAEVAAPVFRKIANHYYIKNKIKEPYEKSNVAKKVLQSNYAKAHKIAQKYKTIMPDVKGLPAMDALAILENMGLRVKLNGSGKVIEQSIEAGKKINKQQQIILKLS